MWIDYLSIRFYGLCQIATRHDREKIKTTTTTISLSPHPSQGGGFFRMAMSSFTKNKAYLFTNRVIHIIGELPNSAWARCSVGGYGATSPGVVVSLPVCVLFLFGKNLWIVLFPCYSILLSLECTCFNCIQTQCVVLQSLSRSRLGCIFICSSSDASETWKNINSLGAVIFTQIVTIFIVILVKKTRRNSIL
jgi:hypothetical protein